MSASDFYFAIGTPKEHRGLIESRKAVEIFLNQSEAEGGWGVDKYWSVKVQWGGVVYQKGPTNIVSNPDLQLQRRRAKFCLSPGQGLAHAQPRQPSHVHTGYRGG